MTLADDDTSSLLTDDANRATLSLGSSFRCWWSSKLVGKCPLWSMRSPRGRQGGAIVAGNVGPLER